MFNGEQIISEPKTKASIRTIILPPSLLQILSEYKKTVDSEWVFPSPLDSAKTRHPSAVRKRLQIMLERAGCPKVRFHDLRHPYVKYTTKNNCDNLMKIFVYTEPIRRMCAKGTQFQSCCRGKRKPALSASLQENLLACRRRSVRRLFSFAADFPRIPHAPILLAPQPPI